MTINRRSHPIIYILKRQQRIAQFLGQGKELFCILLATHNIINMLKLRESTPLENHFNNFINGLTNFSCTH